MGLAASCCIQTGVSHWTRHLSPTNDRREDRSARVSAQQLFGACSLGVFTSALLHFFKGALFHFLYEFTRSGDAGSPLRSPSQRGNRGRWASNAKTRAKRFCSQRRTRLAAAIPGDITVSLETQRRIVNFPKPAIKSLTLSDSPCPSRRPPCHTAGFCHSKQPLPL